MHIIKILFVLVLFMALSGTLYTQVKSSISSVMRITETNENDRHPTFSYRNYYSNLLKDTIKVAFDRTSGSISDICVINLTGQGFSKEVKYITNGTGKNEFPSIANGTNMIMLVFQSKQQNGCNIQYCIYDSNGWSTPKFLTTDNGKSNLYPVVVAKTYGDSFVVVWEKEGAIYYTEYKMGKWTDITNITQGDSLKNTKPALYSFLSRSIIVWQRVKPDCPKGDEFDLKYAVLQNGVWSKGTITAIGNNQNPRFNPGNQNLIWQRIEKERSFVMGSDNILSDPTQVKMDKIVIDSTWNGITFSSSVIVIITLDLIENNILKKVDLKPMDPVYLHLMQKDEKSRLILNCCEDKIIVESSGKLENPVLSNRTINNTYWAVWEDDQSGSLNLYGAYCNYQVSNINNPRPLCFSLEQNYPNPFNPKTSITYALYNDSFVKLEIFNVLGQKIETLIEGWQETGYHYVDWKPINIPGGIYYYRLRADKFSEMKKMIYLK